MHAHSANSPFLQSLNLGLCRRSPSRKGRERKAAGGRHASADSCGGCNLAKQAPAIYRLAICVCGGAQGRSTDRYSGGDDKRGAAVGDGTEDEGGAKASHLLESATRMARSR